MDNEERMSVFQYILNSVSDEGELPEGWSLPAEYTGDEDRWAPGAMDGVYLYHMQAKEPGQDMQDDILTAVKAASAEAENAAELFADLGRKYRALSAADALQQCIITSQDELDFGNIYEFAVNRLFLGGMDTESVKLGMVIMALIDDPEDIIRQAVRLMAVCDEFTLFSIFNMLSWEDPNTEIFEVARKVTGWGRIHAVERLKPENDEIRQWLLKEGWHNSIDPNYSALTILEKCDLPSLLKHHMSRESFSGAGRILQALLNPGPCGDISALPDREAIMKDYLSRAAEEKLTLDICRVIFDIRYWCEVHNGSEDVRKKADALLTSGDCIRLVQNAVPAPEALDLAVLLGVPYQLKLLNALRQDFSSNYPLIRYLMEDPYYRNEVLNLYHEHVPAERLDTAETLQSEPLTGLKLSVLLRELEKTPLCGNDYIIHALASPLESYRSTAMKIVNAWCEKTKKKPEELPEELAEAVRKASAE